MLLQEYVDHIPHEVCGKWNLAGYYGALLRAEFEHLKRFVDIDVLASAMSDLLHKIQKKELIITGECEEVLSSTTSSMQVI